LTVWQLKHCCQQKRRVFSARQAQRRQHPLSPIISYSLKHSHPTPLASPGFVSLYASLPLSFPRLHLSLFSSWHRSNSPSPTPRARGAPPARFFAATKAHTMRCPSPPKAPPRARAHGPLSFSPTSRLPAEGGRREGSMRARAHHKQPTKRRARCLKLRNPQTDKPPQPPRRACHIFFAPTRGKRRIFSVLPSHAGSAHNASSLSPHTKRFYASRSLPLDP
jgi:hypothetical protein